MNRNFLEPVLKGKWLIDPGFVLSNPELIYNVITGKTELEDNSIESKFSAIRGGYNSLNIDRYKQIPSGSVAITPVFGSLFKHDQECGPVGMNTLGNALKKADEHSSISAHLLYIDSPGGTVDGTETFANLVKNTQKPVVAFVDGLMASAALWIGSSADHIFASTDMDEIGSIGVLLSFMDVQPMWEEKGVKFHTVTADQSKDKVKMFEDLRKGEYQEYKERFLNPLAARFQEVVKANRPDVKDDQLTGKVFFARDVIGTLIDGVKSLDEVLEFTANLGNTYHETISKSHTQKSMEQFTHVNQALGVDTLESADGHVALNEEQLATLDALLGKSANSDELETAKANLLTAQNSIQEKDALITSQKEEIKSLKEAAAGPGAVEKSEVEKDDTGNDSALKGEDNTFMNDLQEVEKVAKEMNL